MIHLESSICVPERYGILELLPCFKQHAEAKERLTRRSWWQGHDEPMRERDTGVFEAYDAVLDNGLRGIRVKREECPVWRAPEKKRGRARG